MLNKKQDADVSALNYKSNSQQKPNMVVVPSEDCDQINTANVEENKVFLHGNEAIPLSSKGWEKFTNILNNPPEPSPELREAYKRHLEE